MQRCQFCGVRYRKAAAEVVHHRSDTRPDDVLRTEATFAAESRCRGEMDRHEFFCGCATCRSFTAHGCAHGRACDGRKCHRRVVDAGKVERLRKFEADREEIICKQGGKSGREDMAEGGQ